MSIIHISFFISLCVAVIFIVLFYMKNDDLLEEQKKLASITNQLKTCNDKTIDLETQFEQKIAELNTNLNTCNTKLDEELKKTSEELKKYKEEKEELKKQLEEQIKKASEEYNTLSKQVLTKELDTQDKIAHAYEVLNMPVKELLKALIVYHTPQLRKEDAHILNKLSESIEIIFMGSDSMFKKYIENMEKILDDPEFADNIRTLCKEVESGDFDNNLLNQTNQIVGRNNIRNTGIIQLFEAQGILFTINEVNVLITMVESILNEWAAVIKITCQKKDIDPNYGKKIIKEGIFLLKDGYNQFKSHIIMLLMNNYQKLKNKVYTF